MLLNLAASVDDYFTQVVSKCFFQAIERLQSQCLKIEQKSPTSFEICTQLSQLSKQIIFKVISYFNDSFNFTKFTNV